MAPTPIPTPVPAPIPHHPGPDRVLPGVVMMLGFVTIAPLIDVSAKLASASVPVGQITLARYVVQSACMLPIVVAMGLRLDVPPRDLPLAAGRALMGILSTLCFVGAVSVMPIADALAIAFVEPFFLLLAGRLFLGEAVGPRRIGASVVGFGGALLVIQPAFAQFGTIALLPLGTALFFGLYMLLTRALSRRMHPVAMQFHTAWLAVVMAAPLVALTATSGLPGAGLVWPAGMAWAWLAGVGLAATVSHMLITYALAYAPAATLAPLQYLEIVAAAALGYVIFADFPDPATWAGIGIITASGLYIIHRERAVARADRHRAPAGPPAPPADGPAAG